jgi:hypothetical protein
MNKVKKLLFVLIVSLIFGCKIHNDIANTFDEVYPDYVDQ